MSASEQVIDVITRRLLDIEQHQMSGLRSSQTNDAMTEAAGSIRDDLTSVERDLEVSVTAF